MRIRSLLTIIILILSGCQSVTPAVVSPTNEIIVNPAETPPAETPPATSTILSVTATPFNRSQEWILWNGGPHRGAGQSVDCATCHEMQVNGVPSSLAWLDQASGGYETVADSDVLCHKCHLGTEKVSSLTDPLADVHVSLKCLACHDPHSTAASCANSACHADILKGSKLPPATPADGHQSGGDADCGGSNCHAQATQAALSNPTIHGRHSSVACIACHAANAAQVERSEKTGGWGLVPPVIAGETPPAYSAGSHAVTRQVDCLRCHFDGNAWGLPLVSGHEFGN